MRYVFSNVTPVTAPPPSSDPDWQARSTAGGVELANRLEDSTTLTDWLVNDSTADHVSVDTTIKASTYAAGSFRFEIRNADTTSNGAVCVPFATKGAGNVIWTSYRVMADDAAAYQQFVFNAESGIKFSIMSRDQNGSAPIGSNQNNEIVPSINYSNNQFSLYWQDGTSSGVTPDVGAVTACSGSDFIGQPEIDNGASPLSGNNPATGSAWSSCHQDRARFGGLYSAKSNSEYQPGLGDPVSGGVKLEGGIWFTVTLRNEINALDSTSFTNRIQMWVAKDGEPYKLLCDNTGVRLGNGPSYNGMTLLPYMTNRSGGGRKSTLSGISGVSILGTGGGTALGSGSLEYVASTGAFRFAASNDSYGTARYISAANGIYTMNLKSSLHGTATTSNGSVTLPQSSITLVDASAFPSGGGSFVFGVPDTSNANLSNGNGEQYLTYTGKSGNTLTGCSGGTGTHNSGVDVKIISYIAVRVDNVASLPGSGTTTATVTVSDGRNDGYMYYNDVIISSAAINAPGGYPPTPAWFSASLNTWFNAGSGSQLVNAQTYTEPSGVSHSGICSYSGATLIGTKLYLAGGGHGDGASNAMFVCDLSDDSPVWTLLNTPTPSGGIQVNVSHYSPSGKPSARHTAYDIQGVGARNRVFFMGGYAVYGNGGTATDSVDAFRLDTNDYEAAGTWAAQSGLQAGNAANAVCQDSDGNIYCWICGGGGDLYKWTQSTATWSTMSGGAHGVIYTSPMAHDPIRNRLVLIDGTNSAHYDLDTNTKTTFSTTATRGASFFWCGDLGVFLYKQDGSMTIEQIDPLTFVKSSYSVSGTAPAIVGGASGIDNMAGRIGWSSLLGVVYAVSQNSTNLFGFRTR